MMIFKHLESPGSAEQTFSEEMYKIASKIESTKSLKASAIEVKKMVSSH